MKQKLVQHLSSVENAHRKNTIAIDLSNIFGRDAMPNRLDMFKFVHKKMGIKAEELLEIQSHPFLPQVFVKMKTEEVMLRTENKIKAGLRMDSRNITLHGWRCDIPLTTVKLNGVNYDTTKDRVVQVMSKYGVVESIERGRIDYFKESFVSDGTWLLRIRTEQGKGLPSTLYYEDEGKNTDIWSLIFDGKVSACYKCGDEGHRGDRCRAAKPKQADSGLTAPVGVGTYCDVVKAGVEVEWKGMSDKGDFSKQLSLKPRPARVNNRSSQGPSKEAQSCSRAKVLPICSLPPRVRDGLEHLVPSERREYEMCFPKITNRFSALSDDLEDAAMGEEKQEEEVYLAAQGVKRGRVKSKPDDEREVRKKVVDEKAEDQVMEVQDSEVETDVEVTASVSLLAQAEDKEENVPTQIEQQLGGGEIQAGSQGGSEPGLIQQEGEGQVKEAEEEAPGGIEPASREWRKRRGGKRGGKVSSEESEKIDSGGESEEEEGEESLNTGDILTPEVAAFNFEKAMQLRARPNF